MIDLDSALKASVKAPTATINTHPSKEKEHMRPRNAKEPMERTQRPQEARTKIVGQEREIKNPNDEINEKPPHVDLVDDEVEVEPPFRGIVDQVPILLESDISAAEAVKLQAESRSKINDDKPEIRFVFIPKSDVYSSNSEDEIKPTNKVRRKDSKIEETPIAIISTKVENKNTIARSLIKPQKTKDHKDGVGDKFHVDLSDGEVEERVSARDTPAKLSNRGPYTPEELEITLRDENYIAEWGMSMPNLPISKNEPILEEPQESTGAKGRESLLLDGPSAISRIEEDINQTRLKTETGETTGGVSANSSPLQVALHHLQLATNHPRISENWNDRRWTKISRKLVNQEALELGKERYECRDEFVVVLRFLERAEIQAYVELTQVIRAMRKYKEELAEESHTLETTSGSNDEVIRDVELATSKTNSPNFLFINPAGSKTLEFSKDDLPNGSQNSPAVTKSSGSFNASRKMYDSEAQRSSNNWTNEYLPLIPDPDLSEVEHRRRSSSHSNMSSQMRRFLSSWDSSIDSSSGSDHISTSTIPNKINNAEFDDDRLIAFKKELDPVDTRNRLLKAFNIGLSMGLADGETHGSLSRIQSDENNLMDMGYSADQLELARQLQDEFGKRNPNSRKDGEKSPVPSLYDLDITNEEETEREKGKNPLTASPETVSTINAAQGIFERLERRSARLRAVVRGELSVEEARTLNAEDKSPGGLNKMYSDAVAKINGTVKAEEAKEWDARLLFDEGDDIVLEDVQKDTIISDQFDEACEDVEEYDILKEYENIQETGTNQVQAKWKERYERGKKIQDGSTDSLREHSIVDRSEGQKKVQLVIQHPEPPTPIPQRSRSSSPNSRHKRFSLGLGSGSDSKTSHSSPHFEEPVIVVDDHLPPDTINTQAVNYNGLTTDNWDQSSEASRARAARFTEENITKWKEGDKKVDGVIQWKKGDKLYRYRACTECLRRKQKCTFLNKSEPCTNCARRYPPPICAILPVSNIGQNPDPEVLHLHSNLTDIPAVDPKGSYFQTLSVNHVANSWNPSLEVGLGASGTVKEENAESKTLSYKDEKNPKPPQPNNNEEAEIELLYEAGILRKGPAREDDNDSEISGMSAASSLASVAESLFSIMSASSMSSISGPQGAVDRLVSIFLGDHIFKPLCTEGLITISAERFERNLRRLLKEFAVDLRKEAETAQQRHAAHFVRFRARNSAHMICNALNGGQETKKDKLANEVDFEYISDDNDSSSSEDELDDTAQLELFIKSSKAINRLCEKLRAFVYHEKMLVPGKSEEFVGADRHKNQQENLDIEHFQREMILDTPLVHIEERESNVDLQKSQLLNRSWANTMVHQAISMATSLYRSRPPLIEGKKRIEWRCKCGDRIWDDFTEIRSGAAEQLGETLDYSTSKDLSAPKLGLGSFTRTLSNGMQRLRSLVFVGYGKDTKGVLPLHERQSTSNVTENDNSHPQAPESTSTELLWLLLCYNEGKYATKLLQLDLVDLKAISDRTLFKVMRTNYYAMKGRWMTHFSLRTLKIIKFVEFEMYKSELVDVRKQDVIPPSDNLEYRYQPAPPELIPPVGENHLMHYFHHPDHAENEPLCLDRFPKKLKEKLICNRGIKQGWGLQFVEGWDMKKIWIFVFAFFGLGSLIIGILWAFFKHSIQDAFAIGAYMVAFGTVTVGTIQALLGM